MLVFILILTCPLRAQQSLSANDLYGGNDYKTVLSYQNDYLVRFYYENVDNVDELVNGKEYLPYYFRSKSKPLLYFGRKHESSLTMKGRRYNHLMMDYDTYKDELIYTDKKKFIDYKVFMISLNKDPIDGFTFYFEEDSMAFKYFAPEKNLNFNLPEGFYEVVYNGKSKCIIKHRSYLMVKDGLDEYIYSPTDYIMVNGIYSKLTNKKMFLRLFVDKSYAIKKFIHTNRIHIGKARKDEIATILNYYDSLTAPN